jgi:hypothetical protein
MIKSNHQLMETAMTTYKFAVTAPTAFGTRYVVSRHVTRTAAEKAAKGRAGFEVVAL